jgi:membrane peptidoglycan carboxypeptidase
VASKTGTWEWKPTETNKNAHVWVVGYTKAIAAAAWLGTKSGSYLNPKDGYSGNVFGNNYVGPIWHQFMTNATAMMFPNPDPSLLRFDGPGNTGSLMPDGAVPSPTPTTTQPPPPPPPTNPPSPTNTPSTTPTTAPTTSSPKPTKSPPPPTH